MSDFKPNVTYRTALRDGRYVWQGDDGSIVDRQIEVRMAPGMPSWSVPTEPADISVSPPTVELIARILREHRLIGVMFTPAQCVCGAKMGEYRADWDAWEQHVAELIEEAI